MRKFFSIARWFSLLFILLVGVAVATFPAGAAYGGNVGCVLVVATETPVNPVLSLSISSDNYTPTFMEITSERQENAYHYNSEVIRPVLIQRIGTAPLKGQNEYIILIS